MQTRLYTALLLISGDLTLENEYEIEYDYDFLNLDQSSRTQDRHIAHQHCSGQNLHIYL